jgi:hypothetical protein
LEKCYGKDRGFKGHQNSQAHRMAKEAWLTFQSMKTVGGISDQLNSVRVKVIEENRSYIQKITRIVILCATQKLGLRGHLENETSENRGNLLEMLNVVAESDVIVQKRIHGNLKDKYLSHQIIDELLQCVSKLILEDVVDEAKVAQHFSIICDESKDVSKKEQLSLSIRYVHDNMIHEEFLSFIHVASTDAKTIFDAIISVLTT